MNLREWISNSEEVNEAFDFSNKANVEAAKVLGHELHVKEDTLSFKAVPPYIMLDTTKRVVLKQLSSAFDPLGFLCPVVHRGKLYIQELGKNELKWDVKLCEEDIAAWKVIVSDLKISTSVMSLDIFVLGHRTRQSIALCDFVTRVSCINIKKRMKDV